MPKSKQSDFLIHWIDRHVEPKGRPDPKYPNGIDLDMAGGQRLSCLVALPYPAPRCGYWRVMCNTCHFAVVVTTAGRADDPRTVRLPCGGVEKSRLQ